MGIKATCNSCGRVVNAKEALAGKRVKCPQCKQPMTIPNLAPPTDPGFADAARTIAPNTPAPTPTPQSNYNPLLDLLDDAGVKSVVQGPACDNCGAEVAPGTVICVQCGYNMATGQMLETTVYEDDEFDGGMTDAEKILAKAEQDIDETPIASEDQNFGDGADSVLIAVAAALVFGILLVIGIGVTMSMEQVSKYVGSARISLYASVMVATFCGAWITIIAFMADKVHGIICLCTAGLYCMIFGFMTRGLLMPTIMMIVSTVIGLACYAYLTYSETAMIFMPSVA